MFDGSRCFSRRCTKVPGNDVTDGQRYVQWFAQFRRLKMPIATDTNSDIVVHRVLHSMMKTVMVAWVSIPAACFPLAVSFHRRPIIIRADPQIRPTMWKVSAAESCPNRAQKEARNLFRYSRTCNESRWYVEQCVFNVCWNCQRYHRECVFSQNGLQEDSNK